jgi:hypothetical protein
MNKMGRVVLINSVLDSQLVYLMSALSIPPSTIQQIDKRRRAFMWAGEPQASAAKCLVAWVSRILQRRIFASFSN